MGTKLSNSRKLERERKDGKDTQLVEIDLDLFSFLFEFSVVHWVEQRCIKMQHSYHLMMKEHK